MEERRRNNEEEEEKEEEEIFTNVDPPERYTPVHMIEMTTCTYM